MIKKLNERNGYPDNNFTEEEYYSYIESAKRDLQRVLKSFDSLADTEIAINNRKYYNSILTAENEKELRKKSALLSSIDNLMHLYHYYLD